MIESNFKKDLERKIDLYINGKLNAEEIDDLWAELIQDEYYLDYTKSVVNLKEVIDRKKARTSAPQIVGIRKYARYAAAAAVVLIASVIGIYNYNFTNETGLNSVNPVAEIGLDVVRSAEGVSEDVTSEVIKRAIRLATSGEVEEAIVLLEEEMEKASEPQPKADIALTLGSIQYNHSEYASAIQSFELLVGLESINTLTLEKGYWFLGNAYFQLDRLEEAETAFQNAYDLNGAYSRVAKTYVDALQNVKK